MATVLTSGGIWSPTSARRSHPMVSTGAGLCSLNSRNRSRVTFHPAGSLVANLLFLTLSLSSDASFLTRSVVDSVLTDTAAAALFFALLVVLFLEGVVPFSSSSSACRYSSASSLSRASVDSSSSPSSVLTMDRVGRVLETADLRLSGFLEEEEEEEEGDSACSALTRTSRNRVLERVDIEENEEREEEEEEEEMEKGQR